MCLALGDPRGATDELLSLSLAFGHSGALYFPRGKKICWNFF